MRTKAPTPPSIDAHAFERDQTAAATTPTRKTAKTEPVPIPCCQRGKSFFGKTWIATVADFQKHEQSCFNEYRKRYPR